MKSKSCGHSSCEENGGLCFSPGSLLVWGMLFVCICVFHIADLGPLGYWRLADKAQPRWRRIITWFLQYCSIQNYRHKVFVFAILFVFCDLWLLVNNCRFAVPSTIVCAPFFGDFGETCKWICGELTTDVCFRSVSQMKVFKFDQSLCTRFIVWDSVCPFTNTSVVFINQFTDL